MEYCTFQEGSKILHSIRWYQYCGMAKQPVETGLWDGWAGEGTKGYHLGQEGLGMKEKRTLCYQMVYPPLDPPVNQLLLRCAITTLAPCMAASWAALGGCPGGGGYNREEITENWTFRWNYVTVVPCFISKGSGIISRDEHSARFSDVQM